MTFRAPCVVIGCRRTFKRDADDDGTRAYICGDHYRMADQWLRRMRAKIKRKSRRGGWTTQLIEIDNWLWGKAVRQANERSLGL